MKRKSLLILFLAIASSQILQAQISKGDIFLGGQVYFSTWKTNSDFSNADYKQTVGSFSPALGFVTKDNLVWGFDIPISYFKDNNESPGAQERKSLDAGAGVFVRKYFEVASRFYLFTQGRFGGTYINDKVFTDIQTTTSKGFSVNLSFYPGVSYAIKRNIHLESGFYNLAYINYYNLRTTSSLPGSGKTRTNGFSVNAIASGQTAFTVGVRFFLRSK